jgi:hypothetical protein
VFRKAIEEPADPLFWNLTKAQAEEISEVFGRHGGETWITLLPQPPQLISKVVLILAALAMGALFVALYYARSLEPKQLQMERVPTAISSNVAAQHSGSIKTETKENASPAAPQETLDQDTQRHLKSLIVATATLIGDGSTGSAFFIRPDGILVTNHHVTEKMASIAVQTADGTSRPGKLIKSDPHYDLALIKIDGGPFPTLRLGDATTLEQGETVWTIGAPHGLSFTVTRGIVSFVGRNVKGKSFIQADVAINPGNSGGPMINAKGEVVGINNFVISNAVGLNFAIPINYLFMGEETITRGILPFTSDNVTMSQWRSWESEPTSSIQKVVAPKSPNEESTRENPTDRGELDQLLKELRSSSATYENERARIETFISQLKTQLKQERAQYNSGSETISSESARGQRIADLSRQMIQQELKLSETTIAYCRNQEDRLNRVQEYSYASEDLKTSAASQMEQLRKLRVDATSQRTSKIEELKQIDEIQY